MKQSYKDLRVWERSIELVAMVDRTTAALSREERFGLCAQMRRAAVSIPSNIAEGSGRVTWGERRQFLSQARGSAFELETQVEIAQVLGFLDGHTVDELNSVLQSVGRELSSLIRWLREQQEKR